MVKNTNDNLFLSILTLKVLCEGCVGVCVREKRERETQRDREREGRSCSPIVWERDMPVCMEIRRHLPRIALVFLPCLTWIFTPPCEPDQACTIVSSLSGSVLRLPGFCNQQLYPLSYLPIPHFSLMNKYYFNKCENRIYEIYEKQNFHNSYENFLSESMLVKSFMSRTSGFTETTINLNESTYQSGILRQDFILYPGLAPECWGYIGSDDFHLVRVSKTIHSHNCQVLLNTVRKSLQT